LITHPSLKGYVPGIGELLKNGKPVDIETIINIIAAMPTS
jgi:hypothetical protein